MEKIIKHLDREEFNPFLQKYFDKHFETIFYWSKQLTERSVWDDPDFIDLPKLTRDMAFCLVICDL